MKIKVGVMGSAEEASSAALHGQAVALGQAVAKRDVILVTGATTGLVHAVGKAAHDAGAVHIGVSPAHDESEHIKRFGLPTDACDAIIYTGFGLKGRNVVLVRSCDAVVFIGGSMGSLNEFTIAYDEGRVIGCLTGTGGVADEAAHIVETFQKQTTTRIFYDDDSVRLLEACLAAASD